MYQPDPPKCHRVTAPVVLNECSDRVGEKDLRNRRSTGRLNVASVRHRRVSLPPALEDLSSPPLHGPSHAYGSDNGADYDRPRDDQELVLDQ
jgi:hypothetical protein